MATAFVGTVRPGVWLAWYGDDIRFPAATPLYAQQLNAIARARGRAETAETGKRNLAFCLGLDLRSGDPLVHALLPDLTEHIFRLGDVDLLTGIADD